MTDSTKVKTCPTGKVLKGGKCVPKEKKVKSKGYSPVGDKYDKKTKTHTTIVSTGKGKEKRHYTGIAKSRSRRGAKNLAAEIALNKSISDSTKFKDLPIKKRKKRKK